MPEQDVQDDVIVFIVEDDPSVRRSTERLVRSAGLRVQSFGSAREFLDDPRPDIPACLVLDVRLPDLNGLDLQQQLTRDGLHLPIIFMTGHGDIPMTVRAMKAGAVEFLTKPFKTRALLTAIHSALDQARTAHRARQSAGTLRARYESLTPREREVMRLIVAGMLNKQVAYELATTERTVKFHRAHIMRKMEVGSLADLVRMAGELGIGG
jgi:FixJ family two-component response regulator